MIKTMSTEIHAGTIHRLPAGRHDVDSLIPSATKQLVQSKPPASEKTNAIIGWILQCGVILSAAVILLGLIMFPFHPGGFSTARLLSFPQTLGEVWAGLLILRPQAVITLGLLLLIATPVVRVAVSLVAFALERDRRYVIITLAVLAILMISIFLVGNLVTNAHHAEIQQLHFSYLTVILIFIGAIAAGLFGLLVGVGGGVLFLPLLPPPLGLPPFFSLPANLHSLPSPPPSPPP